MKYSFSILVLFCAINSLSALNPEDFNVLTIENKLGSARVIEYLFVSAQESAYWSADILAGTRQIAVDKKLDFYVYYPEQSAFFDFLAIDNVGQVYQVKNAQVVDGNKSLISFSSQTRINQRIDDLVLCEIVVKNHLNQNIEYFFISPTDSNVWGIELLGSDSYLSPGTELSFLIPLDIQDYAIDLLAIDGNIKTYSRRLTIKSNDESHSIAIDAIHQIQN